MNKAVIYISGTTNETVNNMIVEILFMESKGRLLILGERMLKQMHQHGSE